MTWVQYWGTPNYNEKPITGVDRLWTTGQKQDIPQTLAAQLVALGSSVNFQYDTDNQTGENVKLSADGQSFVLPDGSTRSISDAETYQLAPGITRITASQAVVGKAVKLTSVKCISATAIALTIYDNGTTNAGTVLWTQTMSTGDEAIIPVGIQAINGLYAAFTGTATFDIGAQDAV